MTWKQQQALCEVILNVYKGTFPLTKYYIKKLLPHHSIIHRLSSRKVKKSDKRKILLQRYLILRTLIKPVLKLLVDNGTRVNIDGKGKI
jgi:adenylate kinase family enzyme